MLIKARPGVKYEIIENMIKRDDNMLNIQLLCDIAGVSRSGFYDWRANKPNRQALEESDQADLNLILWAYNYRGYKKGARSIYTSFPKYPGVRFTDVSPLRSFAE